MENRNKNKLILIDTVKEIFNKNFNFNDKDIQNIEKKIYSTLDDININRFENVIIKLREIEEFLKDRFNSAIFLHCIFALEGFIHIFEKNNINRDTFKHYIKSYLEDEDKKQLILAFTFDGKHVCYDDANKWWLNDNKNRGTNFESMSNRCIPIDILRNDNFESVCNCKLYLNSCATVKKLNSYLCKVLDYFYEMRNSEVHRGFPLSIELRKTDLTKNPETQTFSLYLDRDNKVKAVSAVDINILEIYKKVIKNKIYEILRNKA